MFLVTYNYYCFFHAISDSCSVQASFPITFQRYFLLKLLGITRWCFCFAFLTIFTACWLFFFLLGWCWSKNVIDGGIMCHPINERNLISIFFFSLASPSDDTLCWVLKSSSLSWQQLQRWRKRPNIHSKPWACRCWTLFALISDYRDKTLPKYVYVQGEHGSQINFPRCKVSDNKTKASHNFILLYKNEERNLRKSIFSSSRNPQPWHKIDISNNKLEFDRFFSTQWIANICSFTDSNTEPKHHHFLAPIIVLCGDLLLCIFHLILAWWSNACFTPNDRQRWRFASGSKTL